MVRKHNYAGQRSATADRAAFPMLCAVRNEAGVTRIDIFDDIGFSDDGGYALTAKAFTAQLAGIKGALDIHLNSCGGSVFDGMSIAAAIREHKGRTTITVDGLAASIASVIVQAAHERVMSPGSMLMVHDAFGLAVGDAAELRKMAQTLDQVSDNIAVQYAERAGGSPQKWRQTMKQETWYDGSEAVAAGLADRTGTGAAKLPAGFDLAALGNVPGRIAAKLRALPSASPEDRPLAGIERFAGRMQELYDAGSQHAQSHGQVDVQLHDNQGNTAERHTFIFGPGYGPLVTPKYPDPLDDPSYHPGQVRKADGHYRSAAAAELNHYGWSRSLGSYLAAISDRDDRAGAKAVISKVMEKSRLRAAAGLSERIPSEGGYLVPERLADQIASYMTTAVVVPRALAVPMDSLRVPVPLLDAPNQSDGVLGGMTFSMVAEGVTIPATIPEFGRLALEARKAAAYLAAVPNELCDDSPTFSDIFLPRIVARGLAWQEDDLAVNGDGIAEPQGLLAAPAALYQVRATSDTVGVADIVGMVKLLHPQSERSGTAVWLLGDDAFGVLLELATLTGTDVSSASAPSVWLEWDSQAGFWRLLGIPAFPTEHQPELGSTGDVILADLSLYLWGTRGEMTVERSAKGGGFGSDTSNFRFRHRIDGRFWPQSSYTLSNGETVSPLVILEIAA